MMKSNIWLSIIISLNAIVSLILNHIYGKKLQKDMFPALYIRTINMLFAYYASLIAIYGTVLMIMIFQNDYFNMPTATLQDAVNCTQMISIWAAVPLLLCITFKMIFYHIKGIYEDLIRMEKLILYISIMNITDISYYISLWYLIPLVSLFFIVNANMEHSMGRMIGVARPAVKTANDPYPDKRSAEELFIAAVHEAGHYMMAEHLNVEILSADIQMRYEPLSRQLTGGGIRMNDKEIPPTDRICIRYAGYIAEQRYVSEKRILYQCVEISAKNDFQQISNILDYFQKNERYDIYQNCKKSTNDFICQHWNEILAKAEIFVMTYEEEHSSGKETYEKDTV